jgi:hypothetical protein
MLINWGRELSKVCLFRFFLASLHWEDKLVFFLWVQKEYFWNEGFLTYCQRERSENSFMFCIRGQRQEKGR